MSVLEIRKDKEKWAAFDLDAGKPVMWSKCQSCIIKVMLGMTKKSKRYNEIKVYDADGFLKLSLKTGDKHNCPEV